VTPKRIQRRRVKGWRLPPNTVIVDRTSRYGNPWKVREVKGYRRSQWYVERGVQTAMFFAEGPARELAVHNFGVWAHRGISATDLERLRGKDLACFCDPADGMACHADVLLDLANREAT